jgi:hypothetical protein
MSAEHPRPYQAGDTVLHRATGEHWLLCCDEHQGYVSAAGWPETRVPRDAVDLVQPATDAERLSMLRFAASSSGYRADLAARQLCGLAAAIAIPGVKVGLRGGK